MDQYNKIDDVYQTAGTDLSKVLDAYFPNKEDLVRWFYDFNKRLGKSPYEFCEEGKQYELEGILMDLSTGNMGL
ncbi:MAG: hypothetical protein KKA62_02755 [Nanoarchaeota archaeon]|nr:hypothetical protein [Nanoarchaeota archaeon]MBU1644558.1 hypothetical protein [Nanoarchaeota archaeon]MBU1976851.1 hypothetical protein [Nanoarchaeota archaeon]